MISPCISSTYDIDKTNNIILKIPLFYTPASHFSRIVHDTMGDIAEQKLTTMNSFCVFGVSFFAHPLHYILTKHNIKETASKCNIWGTFYIPKGVAVKQ